MKYQDKNSSFAALSKNENNERSNSPRDKPSIRIRNVDESTDANGNIFQKTKCN